MKTADELRVEIERLTAERDAAVCVAMRAGMNGYGMDEATARIGVMMSVNAWLKTPDEAAELAGWGRGPGA